MIAFFRRKIPQITSRTSTRVKNEAQLVWEEIVKNTETLLPTHYLQFYFTYNLLWDGGDFLFFSHMQRQRNWN